MSMMITDQTDADVTVFAAMSGGMLDAILRANSEADWVEGALYYGLVVPTDDGDVVPMAGVSLDYIGPVVITPAVMDGETVTTPAVMDNRFHVNLRVSGPALEKLDDDGFPKWKRMLLNWTRYGEPDAQTNTDEVGVVLSAVSLIDPDTIHTPTRVWL